MDIYSVDVESDQFYFLIPVEVMAPILTRRNGGMRRVWVLILCVACFVPLAAPAQEKSQPGIGNAALEKELFALELKWMKAEFDKKITGPDSMGEL